MKRKEDEDYNPTLGEMPVFKGWQSKKRPQRILKKEQPE